MALSKAEKEQLNDFYRNRDLYNPAEDRDQEVPSFVPKMCGGGAVGMADGGLMDDLGYSNPGSGAYVADVGDSGYITREQQNQLAASNLSQHKMPLDVPKTGPSLPKYEAQGPEMDEEANTAENAPKIEPQAAPAMPETANASGKLSPDQYDQLIKVLSARPSMAQSAMSGIAGLADAIETGVARAGNPGFQKNIQESRQNQRQQQIEALNAKYGHERALQELGLNKARLGEEQRHNIQGEKETEKARQLTAAQQGIESQRLGQQMSHQTSEEEAKNTELQQKGSGLINAIERGLGFGPPLPKTSVAKDVYSTPQAQAIKAQYQAGKISKAQARAALDKLYGPR